MSYTRGHGQLTWLFQNQTPPCSKNYTCIMINQDIYYTGTKENPISANIFTIKIYIEHNYLNIQVNIMVQANTNFKK